MRILNKELWPYVIEVPIVQNTHAYIEIDNWCREVFGLRHKNWYAYNRSDNFRTYAFKEEADLLVFKLRYKTC